MHGLHNAIPCQNNAQCINVPGAYICVCSGYWTGKNCELDEKECSTNPCHNIYYCNYPSIWDHLETLTYLCQVDSSALTLWTGPFQTEGVSGKPSACIKESLGVRDSQKLPWGFQNSVPGSLGLPNFKDIRPFIKRI